ncbi:uncharacterized protein NPIL_297921 [Nephila pilipes]|uniref:Uncharacterized protein n=1 Tax=Nephila pilipes TaxID=299642 RepID=A0A8X6T9N2_NEPPI|nr:uncharacterized protein NPIL_297921 [Nephila pilipes]
MFPLCAATLCCAVLAISCLPLVDLHAIPTLRARLGRGFGSEGDLRLEPTEAIVFPGSNVTFICSHSSNVTFRWNFSSSVKSFDVLLGTSRTEDTGQPVFYSRLSIPFATRTMTGEVVCSTEEDHSKVSGFLIVNGK